MDEVPQPMNGKIDGEILEQMQAAAKEAIETLYRIIKPVIERISSDLISSDLSRSCDSIMRMMAKNPREYYLYKHARKWRVRNKYKNLFMRRLSKVKEPSA